MKASHIFLFGVVFAVIYNFISRMINGGWTFDGSYNFWEVMALIAFISIWYSIDNKLNKTYKVTRWD